MTDPDAYPSEMTNPFGPTDDELDGVFAGVAPADSLEEVAAFMLEVKTTCSDAPREEVAHRHIAAMVEESRHTEGARPLIQEEIVTDRTRWRKAVDKMIATALKGAAGVLAASMSMMGLAYAGVDLPGQAAANALEAVTGVELPNQSEDHDGSSVADDVKSVVENSEAEGCEFGQEVAAAASQNAQDETGSQGDPCTASDNAGDKAQGSKATGDEKAAQGRATATEKSGGASEAGAANADAGDDNADAGTDRATGGSDNSSTGKATADDRSSEAGSDDIEDDSSAGSDGQGTASEQSGGASDSGADRRP